MSFRELKELSPTFNKSMNNFIVRIDCMYGRDRELFYDLIGFAFDEGRIKGKEEILLGETKTKQKLNNGEKQEE